MPIASTQKLYSSLLHSEKSRQNPRHVFPSFMKRGVVICKDSYTTVVQGSPSSLLFTSSLASYIKKAVFIVPVAHVALWCSSAVRMDLAGMSRSVLIPSETELFVDRNTLRYCPLKWPRAQRTQRVTAVTAAFGARFRVTRATIVVEKWMRHSFFLLLASSATTYTTETFSCHWFTGFLFLGFWLWR